MTVRSLARRGTNERVGIPVSLLPRFEFRRPAARALIRCTAGPAARALPRCTAAPPNLFRDVIDQNLSTWQWQYL
jgi:hypothetical protein